MTLLQMVNSVLGKIREERVTVISGLNLVVNEVVEHINDAGAEILSGHDWDFDIRHDGRLWNPPKMTGTHATTFYTAPDDNTDISTTFALWYNAGFGSTDENAINLAGDYRSRVQFPQSEFPDTSAIVDGYTSGLVTFSGTLANSFHVSTGTWTVWETYVFEHVLPTTVKDVLSIRSQERDIPVEFINKEFDFDGSVYRPQFSFSDDTEVAMVGSSMRNTSFNKDGGGQGTTIKVAERTGTGLTLWPIPENAIHLDYSYRIQHSDLSAATDEWVGVPDDIIRIIEWQAVQNAYDTDLRNDPEKAARAERHVEKRLARALHRQSRQPHRRRVPKSFGSRRVGHNGRRRWSSQTVPAP